MDRDSSLGMVSSLSFPWKSTLPHWYSHRSFVLYAGSAKSLHVLFARNGLGETRKFKFRECKLRSRRILPKDRFKNTIRLKEKVIKYFCKINVLFLYHFLSPFLHLFPIRTLTIRVLYIFINNPSRRKFSKHRTESRKDWRKKGKAIGYLVGGQQNRSLKGMWRSHVARANREKRFLARNIGVLEGYRMNNAE